MTIFWHKFEQFRYDDKYKEIKSMNSVKFGKRLRGFIGTRECFKTEKLFFYLLSFKNIIYYFN